MEMIKKVNTKEISIEKWKNKLRSADMKWLAMQYRGLKHMIDSVNEEFECKFAHAKVKYGEIVPDDVYKDTFYQLENEMMDIDIQLVDVEEEFERRGIELAG